MTKPKRTVAAGWLEIKGDDTLALDWPIDEKSVVFEIGGYEGRWSLQMLEKYNPRMYIFEPQFWAFEKILEKTKDYRPNVFNFALWTHDKKMTLGDFGRDGASLLKPYHQDKTQVTVVDVFQFMHEHFPHEDIDVCLMNIEGGEFVLLPYMIGTGLMSKIKYFWMQLHWFVPMAHEKFEAMNVLLEQTHEIIWDYRPAATCWKRRDL